jgi:threonine/homoserine/homoserine lactone efflux protein
MSTFLQFLLVAALLTLSPGPDILFVLAKGMEQGRKIALATAWGMCSGCFAHTLAVALGVSALCMAEPRIFIAIKIFGASYLLYLAYKTVRSAVTLTVQAEPATFRTAFQRGVLMNLLNPKVALFFIAFLPQFVNHTSSVSVPVQLATLGLLFTAQGFFWFTLVGLFSGFIGGYIQRSAELSRILPYCSAAVLILISIFIIVA